MAEINLPDDIPLQKIPVAPVSNQDAVQTIEDDLPPTDEIRTPASYRNDPGPICEHCKTESEETGWIFTAEGIISHCKFCGKTFNPSKYDQGLISNYLESRQMIEEDRKARLKFICTHCGSGKIMAQNGHLRYCMDCSKTYAGRQPDPGEITSSTTLDPINPDENGNEQGLPTGLTQAKFVHRDGRLVQVQSIEEVKKPFRPIGGHTGTIQGQDLESASGTRQTRRRLPIGRGVQSLDPESKESGTEGLSEQDTTGSTSGKSRLRGRI